MALGLYAAVVVLFAGWCTLHVWLCFRLARLDFRKGVLSFLVFPLAGIYGYSLGIGRLASAWLMAASLYFVLLSLTLVL